MRWTVYIIKCADKTLYTGITTNLERRLTEHSDGKGARYTKGRGPFKLVYKEPCKTRSTSLKRKLEIKALHKTDKVALVKSPLLY